MLVLEEGRVETLTSIHFRWPTAIGGCEVKIIDTSEYVVTHQATPHSSSGWDIGYIGQDPETFLSGLEPQTGVLFVCSVGLIGLAQV